MLRLRSCSSARGGACRSDKTSGNSRLAPRRIASANVGAQLSACFISLNRGRESAMRRRSEPNTFDERLSTEEALITAALENTGPGPRRNLLELKLRRIETARLIGGWVSPTGVRPSPGTRLARPKSPE